MHQHRNQDDGHQRKPTRQRGHHILHGGAGGRSDHPNAARQDGNGPLQHRVEQSLGLQLRFQRLQRSQLGAQTCGLHVLADQLQVAARRVDAEARPHTDLIAIVWHRFDQPVGGLEHRRAQLGFAVLQREVPVAGRGARKVGDFTFDPHRAEVGFDDVAQKAAQFGNGVDGREESGCIPYNKFLPECRTPCLTESSAKR